MYDDIITALIKISPGILTTAGILWGYHKIMQSRIDQKVDKETYDKDMKYLEKRNDERDNEIKDLIKDLKVDMKDRLEDIKIDINYLRDRDCKVNKKE